MQVYHNITIKLPIWAQRN